MTKTYNEASKTQLNSDGGQFHWCLIRKPLITLFIIFNVTAISLYLLPSAHWRDVLIAPFNPYLWYTGLWQNFCVFVPDPKQYNIYLTAVVKFADGSTKEWEFPRMEKLDVLTRMRKDRFRKWASDNVNSAEYCLWWPDTGRYIARKFKNANNPPTSVTLVRHWTPIPAPGITTSVKQTINNFYTYEITPVDLN